MSVYVCEIEGRAIAASGHDNLDDAEAWFQSEPFQADLLVLESQGRPVWDGVSDLHVRRAMPEEEAIWEKSRARAILAKELDADDEDWLAFLVAVSDPTD